MTRSVLSHSTAFGDVAARSVCVVLHDVGAPNIDACERLMQAVGEVAPVPFTLLAVPRYHLAPHSEGFAQWLAHRVDAGDELALHGYTHQDDGATHGLLDRLKRRHYTRGEGEFSDLNLTEATRRITAGVRWLSRHRLTARGFVAPAWLMSEGTWEALRWQPFAYTCTLRELVLLPERRALVSQSIVYSCSSAWRRQASRLWNTGVALSLRRNPLVRLELHPQDALHANVRRSWQKILEAELSDRRATTLGAVAERFRVGTDWDSFDSAPFDEDFEHPRTPQTHDEGAAHRESTAASAAGAHEQAA
jgi:predicted deacetylase